jgi:hypothetical protein
MMKAALRYYRAAITLQAKTMVAFLNTSLSLSKNRIFFARAGILALDGRMRARYQTGDMYRFTGASD